MEAQPKVTLHKTYLKDVSFETHHALNTFDPEKEETLHVDVVVSVSHLKGNLPNPTTFEVMLKKTARITQGGRDHFLVEAEQAGVFTIGNCSTKNADFLLHNYCPRT
jgi:protein-export chaperone SecB